MRALLIAALFLLCACGDPPPPEEKAAATFTSIGANYQDGALFSLWSSAPNDLWAAGGEQGSPIVLRFDGSAWRRDDPPVSQQLWWVHGFAGGPVFVAGDGGAIARWQNDAWETFDTRLPGTTFYGIWGAAPNDVWAVGGPQVGADPAIQQGDVVAHFDGTKWSTVAVDALAARPMSAERNLFKVWGANARDVFIVGSGALTLHYDGSRWNKVANPTDTSNSIFTISGRGANDVFAVSGGIDGGLIHWNGSAWSAIELPAEHPSAVQGVWTAPGQPVWISGFSGYVACHDDQGRWAVSDPITQDALHAIWGDGAGAIWSSGGDIVSFADDYHGALIVSGRSAPALP